MNQTAEVPPPPPHLTVHELNNWENLPPGWAIAYQPNDGRMYYWDKTSGRTSWNHPLANAVEANFDFISVDQPRSTRRRLFDYPWSNSRQVHDTPRNATVRPENHQCYALASLILCFPIGICAIYQSIMVDRCWSQGYFGDAVNHSRQASHYACFGTFVGTIFWIWFFFFEGLMRLVDEIKFD